MIGVIDFVEAEGECKGGEKTDDHHARFMGLQEKFDWGAGILER